MSPARAGSARTLAGIALAVLSTLFFATMDTTSKVVVVSGVAVLVAAWGRYVVQAILTTAVVLPRGGWQALRTGQPLNQLLRGLLLVSSTVLMFASLRFMPVGEYTAILMLSPLTITLVAGLVFREFISPVRWLLVAGGFAGTMVIIRPGTESFTLASVLPLAQVACNTAFQLLTARMARTEDPLTTHLYTGWTGALVLTLGLPFAWEAMPSPGMWGLIALMGTIAAIGHFVLILAYQRAPATTLQPYMYAQIPFAMAGGWLAFSHVPDGWSAVGIAMIAFCGVASALLTILERRWRGA